MKELTPRGSEFFSLRAVAYGIENHFYHIRWPPLNVTIFIMQLRYCMMGATQCYPSFIVQINNQAMVSVSILLPAN